MVDLEAAAEILGSKYRIKVLVKVGIRRLVVVVAAVVEEHGKVMEDKRMETMEIDDEIDTYYIKRCLCSSGY